MENDHKLYWVTLLYSKTYIHFYETVFVVICGSWPFVCLAIIVTNLSYYTITRMNHLFIKQLFSVLYLLWLSIIRWEVCNIFLFTALELFVNKIVFICRYCTYMNKIYILYSVFFFHLSAGSSYTEKYYSK